MQRQDSAAARRKRVRRCGGGEKWLCLRRRKGGGKNTGSWKLFEIFKLSKERAPASRQWCELEASTVGPFKRRHFSTKRGSGMKSSAKQSSQGPDHRDGVQAMHRSRSACVLAKRCGLGLGTAAPQCNNSFPAKICQAMKRSSRNRGAAEEILLPS